MFSKLIVNIESLFYLSVFKETVQPWVVDPDPEPDPDPYWIRIQSGLWIRIRIRIRNPDPDPDPGGKYDPQK
jgi:hypothetical protein